MIARRRPQINNGRTDAPVRVHTERQLERPVARMTLDYQATPDVMIYGRVAKGFKSGGFNGRANAANAATEYDPETVWSFEGGFKSGRQSAHLERRIVLQRLQGFPGTDLRAQAISAFLTRSSLSSTRAS